MSAGNGSAGTATRLCYFSFHYNELLLKSVILPMSTHYAGGTVYFLIHHSFSSLKSILNAAYQLVLRSIIN